MGRGLVGAESRCLRTIAGLGRGWEEDKHVTWRWWDERVWISAGANTQKPQNKREKAKGTKIFRT